MKKVKTLDWRKIDKSWTLFLDRDGVINKKLPEAYVRNINEFEFLPGVLDAISFLSTIFGRIIIVTNQQGIGKGIMNETELNLIHEYMKNAIEKAGGRIDAIFYAPKMQGTDYYMRKPGIGMALAARKLYKDLKFEKSIMVGDSITDMIFAQRLGMYKVFLNESLVYHEYLIDALIFNSLYDFSLHLKPLTKIDKC